MAKTRKKPTEEEKKKKRREQKKLSMRKAREKLKKNPIALEEKRRKDREYYYRQKSQGKIKKIQDLAEREQRHLRNKWAKDAKLRRDRLKAQKQALLSIDQKTPPSSPAPSSVSSLRSRSESGRAVAEKNKRRLKNENLLLKSQLKVLANKLAKYKMRCNRLRKEKKHKQTKKTTRKKENKDVASAVREFLLSDDSSRSTAGKKETITRFKQKKQIRLLNESLINLHKKFVTQTNLKISYKTFCRYRPFWVLNPKVAARETCLCAIHTNMELLVKSLKNSHVINENSPMAVSKSICCEEMTEKCLERTCLACRFKKIAFNQFTPNDTAKYERWVTKKVMHTIKGQEKLCQKTIKEVVVTSKQQLAKHLTNSIGRFMKHVCITFHQFNVVKDIKTNMSSSEGLLHIDFSENYNCKYSSEIQSAHFGGSKGQLSLHTVVFYYVDENTEEKRIIAKSFCTVSDILNHGPIYICAHLTPIIAKMKTLVPTLKRLHILSDGPSTQYKNKTMFHLIAAYLSKETQASSILWHYSASGHGKGAPDGVGGCLKRTADKHVAKGNDVNNIDTFIECVHQDCKGIDVIKIDDAAAKEIERLIQNCKICPFYGTMQVHQVTWDKREPKILQFRRLSCTTCAPGAACVHYNLGHITLDLNSRNEIPAPSPTSSSIPSPLLSIESPLLSSNWSPIVSQLLEPRDNQTSRTMSSPSIFEPQINESEEPTCSKTLRGIQSQKRIRYTDVYSDISTSPPLTRAETPKNTVRTKKSRDNWKQSFFDSSDDEEMWSNKKT